MDQVRNQQIRFKLVDLIRPHDVLYNKRTDEQSMEARTAMWAKVSAEMNETFNMHWSIQQWRNKWLIIRRSYRETIKKDPHSQNARIVNELGFLRPYVTFIQARQTAYEPGRAAEENEILVSTTTAPYTLNQQQYTTADDESISIDDSDDECEEPSGSTYEIFIEDDDDDNSMDTRNNQPSEEVQAATTVNVPEVEGDASFLALIASELRAMTPVKKKLFKKNVANLLYA